MPSFGRTLASIWCLVVFEVYRQRIITVKGEDMCNPATVVFDQCKDHETCVSKTGTSGVCECKTGFVKNDNGLCQLVPQEPNPSASPDFSKPTDSGDFGFNLLLWLLIPVLVAGAIGGIVYTGRKKMWFQRFYSMRVRSYNNVLVSSQDEDDPPIA